MEISSISDLNMTIDNAGRAVPSIPFNICRDSCVAQCRQIIYEQMINNFLMFPILASALFCAVFVYISVEGRLPLDDDKKIIFETVSYYAFALGILLMAIFFFLMKSGIHIDQLIKI